MKKKKEVENEMKCSPMKYKTIDLLKMIKEGFSDFCNTSDNTKKLEYLGDVVFGVFIYNLLRYDNSNYKKLFDSKDKENEGGE